MTFAVGSSLDEVKRELIRHTIRFAASDKTLAAKILGLGVRTLYRPLERCADSECVGRRNGDGIVWRNGPGM